MAEKTSGSARRLHRKRGIGRQGPRGSRANAAGVSMIGRGRVISLTPSGAHLGAEQELSDLSHPQPFQKVQRTATPPVRHNEKRAPTLIGSRRPEQAVYQASTRSLPYSFSSRCSCVRGARERTWLCGSRATWPCGADPCCGRERRRGADPPLRFCPTGVAQYGHTVHAGSSA